MDIKDDLEFKEKVKLIQQSRMEMHRLVDEKHDTLLNKLLDDDSMEKVMSLSVMPVLFKGKKAVSVIYADDMEVKTKTWIKVATELLKTCNENEKMHSALMGLRNKVAGRDRIMLSDKPDTMFLPVEIDKDLYFEAKYDTESLLRIICKRIFNVIGYDYSGISIKFK